MIILFLMATREKGKSAVLYHAVVIEHLTCTSYCNCHGEDGSYKPYTQEISTTQAADLEMEEAEEQDIEVAADEVQS